MKVRMRAMVLLITLLCSASYAHSPRPGAKDLQAIRAVIEQEFQALQRGDGATAYALISPEVRRKFRSSDTFVEMLKNNYRPVAEPQAFSFLQHAFVGRSAVQLVEIVTTDAQVVLALFVMNRQPDQRWMIASCELRPSFRSAA
jgi:hypothetical protein